MRMCECGSNHIKYNFRCKKRRNVSLLGLRFNCSLEYTIIHFWLYMIFLGILLAFVLKGIGCFLKKRLAKKNNCAKAQDACKKDPDPCSTVSCQLNSPADCESDDTLE
ncbi:hypothetical protein RUM43_004867 [Polyplax serrata]|uniref:Uncharacterized protein n=1 Tax=Polyplax serrata TaxID=468196 RepID=A0AAN8XQP5_POLSC